MLREMTIGAPSRNSEDASIVAGQLFKRTVFPIQATVVNLMPRDIALPEVRGLFLKHCANRDGLAQKTVQINDYATLQRLVSSIKQIACLGKIKAAVKLIHEVPDSEPEAETVDQEEVKTEEVVQTESTETATVEEETVVETKPKSTRRSKKS